MAAASAEVATDVVSIDEEASTVALSTEAVLLLKSRVNNVSVNKSHSGIPQDCSDRGTVWCGDGRLVDGAICGAGGSQASEECGGEKRREVDHYE